MRTLVWAVRFALCGLLVAGQGAMAATLSVPIDQSTPLALPAGARNVMVGNPAIADINVLDDHNVVVLGRSYGVTNLLVTDARGRTLVNHQIVVSAPEVNRISMYRGNRVDNYACSPRCERTPMPGEQTGPYNDYAQAYVGYSGRTNEAKSGAGTAKPLP